MRNLRSVIFGLGCLLGGVFLANLFGAEAGAQQQTVERIWAAEDCKNISDASGLFLYVSGENLEEGERLTTVPAVLWRVVRPTHQIRSPKEEKDNG